MGASERYPHGECECRDGCQCELVTGPAAWQVTRDGRTLRVCTRCTLLGDTDRILLVTVDTPADVFRTYDYLGFIVIAGTLGAEARGD